MKSLPWVDFTRRNDPAHPFGPVLLQKSLDRYGAYVFCFWTKNPGTVADLYRNQISQMMSKDTLVLAQVTLNNYSSIMEPGVPSFNTRYQGLDRLLRLIGGPGHIKLRIDPIILGYTTPNMIRTSLEAGRSLGIRRFVMNFFVPSYKGVGNILIHRGLIRPNDLTPSQERILSTARFVSEEAQRVGAILQVCAESNWIGQHVSGIQIASCSDPTWATQVRPELTGIFKANPSRKDCGCCYSADWGVYASRGGYKCSHNCLYCYAQ